MKRKILLAIHEKGDVSAIEEKGKYIDCVSMTNSAGWTGHALTPEEKGVESLSRLECDGHEVELWFWAGP